MNMRALQELTNKIGDMINISHKKNNFPLVIELAEYLNDKSNCLSTIPDGSKNSIEGSLKDTIISTVERILEKNAKSQKKKILNDDQAYSLEKFKQNLREFSY